MTIEDIKAGTIEEYFGTLQQSTVETWKKHLKTNKYSNHIALNDFYEDIVDLVDTLIEDYMGMYGKIEKYLNNFKEDEIDTIDYLKLLREFTITGREDLIDKKDTEIYSDIDAILSLIDSTLYKLNELKESKRRLGLTEYIREALNEEADVKALAAKVNKLEKDTKKAKEEAEKAKENAAAAEKEANKAEESIKSEKDFRDYAKNKFAEVFGDKLDKDKMNEVIKGILDKHKEAADNGDWGKLVGVLNKSFGK